MTVLGSVGAMGPFPDDKTPVERYGRLRVENLRLVSQSGNPIQLRGFSTHDIAGFDWLLSPEYLDQLVHVFHADVVRLAMYTERQGTGYMANPATFDLVQRVMDDVEKAGLYCIVDWHILSDGNPNKYKAAAIDFFDRMSKANAGKKNVIYEICNEPNGDVTWEKDIRPYAVDVLATIRKNDPTALVLVGTAHWSSDVDLAALHPIADPNLMYVFHFYAGSYGQERRDRIAKTLKTIPLFCSEWGTTADSGDGPPFPAETRAWLKFLDDNGISNCNWSLSTEAEGSAAFIHSFDFDAPLVDSLSASGKIVFAYLNSPRPKY
jgi:endoglucanase